jgi:2-keto-4-pentenoate hydratase/2-oxohepta-3-ene-1,7-dioic acid hydratase in catechol pathway
VKLGRILRSSPDGDVARIVSVEPERKRVIDLAYAEQLRLRARGATAETARRLAVTVFPSSMTTAISEGRHFLDAAHEAVASRADEATIPIDGVTWLAAIDPPAIRDPVAFRVHLEHYFKKIAHQLHPNHYRMPAYYKGSTARLFGHDATIPWPSYSDFVDYELELGFVLARGGHNLTPDECEDMIFGVTIFNDFSARDQQDPEMRLTLGPTLCKDFGNALGPWITTIDEVGDPLNLQMIARVNGEEWSRGVSSGMRWSPAELIAYISTGDDLRPGDVLGSGTVGGGSGYEIDRKLAPGNVVELEVERLGVLRNRLGPKETRRWSPGEEERREGVGEMRAVAGR